MFKIIKTLSSNVLKNKEELNRKKDFIWLLVMHRSAHVKPEFYSQNKVSEHGSVEYDLIKNGMESSIHNFIPEKTLANLLEILWKNHIYSHYFENFNNPFDIVDEKSKNRVNELISVIECTIANNPQASLALPKFEKFYDYLLFHLQKEHSDNNKINANFGYVDEFFDIALVESKNLFLHR